MLIENQPLTAIRTERKIFFYGSGLSPKTKVLLGGQRVTMEHVQILRQNGVDAFVVWKTGRWSGLLNFNEKTPDWFCDYQKFTRILNPDKDLVVVPGRYIVRLSEVPGKNKILFIQQAYITLAALGIENYSPSPWDDPSLQAIICVSDSNAELIKLVNPRCSVFVVPNAVDSTEFNFAQHKEQLLLVPSLARCEKNPLDTKAVVHIFNARRRQSKTEAVDIVIVEGYSRPALRDLLSRARALLFLSTHEGLGLLPIEAMQSGVMVLGLDREPMSEYLPNRCQFRFGDIEGLVYALESLFAQPEDWRDVVEEGLSNGLRYTKHAQIRGVLETYGRILHDLESQ